MKYAWVLILHLWIMLQNELAILEFIHLLVETMDRHFGNVVSPSVTGVCGVLCFMNFIVCLPYLLLKCLFFWSFHFLKVYSSKDVFIALFHLQCELDIMFHLEKAHFMLEEMVMNGCIVETSKANILTPIQLMDKTSWKRKGSMTSDFCIIIVSHCCYSVYNKVEQLISVRLYE